MNTFDLTSSQAQSIIGTRDAAGLVTQNGAVHHFSEWLNEQPKKFPRKETLLELLRRFDLFASGDFEFFRKGLEGTGKPLLEPSTLFPTEAVLGVIVAQMQEDSEIIIRAALQRTIPHFQATLDLADRLAYLSMQTAVEELDFRGRLAPHHNDNFTALTYFQKSHEIRVLPYAPVALIGIPFSCLTETQDLLAIPHEVGHFIYHHRSIDPSNDPVSRTYTALTNPLAHWQEEVFADVCAALIAGAVMVFDFQELSKCYHRDFFIDRRDKHPAPFLRPFLYSHALRAWGDEQDRRLANRLDERWNKELAKRWCDELDVKPLLTIRELVDKIQNEPESFQFQVDGQQEFFEELLKALKHVTMRGERMILGPELAALADQALARLWMNKDWTLDPYVMEQDLIAKNYDLPKWFSKARAQELADSIELVELEHRNVDPWSEWIEDEKFFGDQTLAQLLAARPDLELTVGKDTFDIFHEPANPLRAVGDQEYFWQQLWFASGWTTGPGHSNPPGGKPPKQT